MMKTLLKSAVFTAALALTACAGMQDKRYTVSPSEPHGIITKSVPNPAKDIYEVRFQEIDGHQVLGDREALWLAPGEHTIKVAAILDNPTTTLPSRHNAENIELVLNVEEGKSYRIGAELFGNTTKDWKPVVVSIKDLQGYEQ